MKRWSLASRLTFLFAHASAALLLGLGLLISNLVEHHFEALDVDVLSGKLELAQHALANARTPEDLAALPRQFDASMVGHHGLALLILGPDGKTLFASRERPFPQTLLEPPVKSSEGRTISWTSRDGTPFRVISAKAPLGLNGAPPATVWVAMDVSHHRNFLANFQGTLWFIVVLAAILSGFLGRMAVRRGLAPLQAIKQGASAITANRLDYRLPVEAVPAELGELVLTLNTMLDRLEEAFQRLSDFSSDLAHELRTPVSNLLMQTQVILSKSRTAEEYRETLYSNTEEFARLSRMIADMLFLAKADHGLVAPFKETVDFVQEANKLFSYFEAVAEGKNIDLRLEGRGCITGDKSLLQRALSNLLSNAIRHTPASGWVRVVLESDPDDGALLVGIENNGEPIANEHIPRLFERFYRADASRQGSADGVGLGLAIVKSIVKLHSGTIGVRCENGVTRFEMRFPHQRNIS